jgi:hypothetical protein
MTDIECPRCYRIDFGWQARHFCGECGWTIRPAPLNGPAFGFDVLVEKTVAGRRVTEVRHFKTASEASARSKARARGKVLAVVPLSEAAWRRAYGNPEERGT